MAKNIWRSAVAAGLALLGNSAVAKTGGPVVASTFVIRDAHILLPNSPTSGYLDFIFTVYPAIKGQVLPDDLVADVYLIGRDHWPLGTNGTTHPTVNADGSFTFQIEPGFAPNGCPPPLLAFQSYQLRRALHPYDRPWHYWVRTPVLSNSNPDGCKVPH